MQPKDMNAKNLTVIWSVYQLHENKEYQDRQYPKWMTTKKENSLTMPALRQMEKTSTLASPSPSFSARAFVLALKLVLAILTSNPSFSAFSLAWGCKLFCSVKTINYQIIIETY